MITPLPIKLSDKNARELKLANAAITDMQMRQRDVAALDAKYTKELADAKAENDALRDDVAAGRRRLYYQSSLSVSAQATTPPAWIMQPPPDWQTLLNSDYFTLRERLITMQKQLEGTQKYINGAVQIEPLWYRWQLMQIIVSNTHTLPAEYKCLK